jgi:transcriptional regulator with XRE-family HTH domain
MIKPEQLKKIRIEKNLSQEEMASKLGCTQFYLSHLENGKKPITHKFELKLKALGYIDEESILEAEYQAELKECAELMKKEPTLLKEIIAAIIKDPVASRIAAAAINGDKEAIDKFSNYMK